MLDCSDVCRAVASLATGATVSQKTLIETVMAFDDEWGRWPLEDPFEVLPRELLASIGRDLGDLSFDGCLYFHGSRTQDPGSFIRDGLLSLADAIEPIWRGLYLFVAGVCSADEWADFRRWIEGRGGGHFGHLYRMKVADSIHHGPFTVLVRETLLAASSLGLHDYLAIPEIVEDIAICFESATELISTPVSGRTVFPASSRSRPGHQIGTGSGQRSGTCSPRCATAN